MKEQAVIANTKSKMKLRTAITIGLVTVLVCLQLTHSFLGLAMVIAVAAWIAIVAIFSLVLLLQAFRTKQFSVLYPVPIIVAVFFIGFSSPAKMMSPYLRLFIEEEKYTRAIEAVLAGDNSLCEELHCIVEDKDKRQVAFVWDGIIDNWYGICHDPTATVLKANILKGDFSNRNDPEYLKAGRMFEGMMTGVTHLWDNWYFCNFT